MKRFLVTVSSGVRSLKEKWERNGKGIHKGYGQSSGNGKGTGNLSMKKITPAKKI